MKLEIGTRVKDKDNSKEFVVKDIKLFPKSNWPFVLICLVELQEMVEVEIRFETFCEWFIQTEWEIVK